MGNNELYRKLETTADPNCSVLFILDDLEQQFLVNFGSLKRLDSYFLIGEDAYERLHKECLYYLGISENKYPTSTKPIKFLGIPIAELKGERFRNTIVLFGRIE